MSDITYCVSLSMDEFHWLTELIEEKKMFYEKELVGCIGDDREWYLELLPIAERVEQEFNNPTKFVPRPRQCSCGCSHIIGYNDDGPCGMWKTGANGRCVYCDHSKGCHESVGRELWRKQNDK